MEKKKRTVGHPRNFETPEDLEDLWIEYKEYLETTKKWPKIQYVGRNGEKRVDYPKTPMTLKGFFTFARMKVGYIDQYFKNQDGYYTEYISICRAIRDEIEAEHTEGALLNMLNPSITQRLHGMSDNLNVTEKPDIKFMGKDIPDE